MKNRISRWIDNRVSAAYRRKRFRRAAAMRAWYRGVGAVVALWVLWSVMDGTAFKRWERFGHVLIALAYLWTDIHYKALELQRRYVMAELRRRL